MTSVLLNKVGMDLVDVEVSQRGASMTDMFFQDPVLDYTREYVLGVSELVVPLGEEPMLSGTKANNLIMACRTKALIDPSDGSLTQTLKFNQQISLVPGDDDPALDSRNPAHGSSAGRFEASKGGAMIQTPAQFFDALRKWLKNLDHYVTKNLAGVATFNLRLLVSPGGTISIQGDNGFWRRHYFELSQYGRRLLGSDQLYIHMGVDGTSSLKAGNFLAANAAGEAAVPNSDGVISVVPGGDTMDFAEAKTQAFPFVYQFKYSALRYMESRLRIEVDADLSIPANILVENGEQKMHYNIASYALETNYRSQINLDSDNRVSTDVAIIAPSYVSDTVVKRKVDATTDWYRLQDSSNVQNMRLHIFVVRREFDNVNLDWKFARNKLTISPDARWSMTMKFVQQF